MKVDRRFAGICAGILIFAAAAAPVSGENRQRIIPVDSEVYDLLELVAICDGRVLLSDIRPYSEAEVLGILEQVNRLDLPPQAWEAYLRILKLIDTEPLSKEADFAFDVSAAISPELYLHTSEDESRWLYGYRQRASILTLGFEAWFNDGFYGILQPELRESRFLIDALAQDGSYAGNISNIPAGFHQCDYHFPYRGFLAAGGGNWSVQAGRDRLEFGNGETGKLLLSSNPDYFDFIRFKGFSEWFAFGWSFINLEGWGLAGNGGDARRAFVGHSLEIRPFDFLSVYVNESVLFSGTDFELGYINPLTIYHNLFIREIANSIMAVGFDLAPLKGVSLYGEYAMDQLQTAQEQDLYPGADAIPNADGFLVGLKGCIPAGPGIITGGLEFVHTSPWLYIRESKGLSFVWRHRVTTDILKARVNVDLPLGYQYGPDAMVLMAEAGYSIPSLLDAGLRFTAVWKGENTLDTSYRETGEAALMKTPSGTPETTLCLALYSEYRPWDFLSVRLESAVVGCINAGHTAGADFLDLQNMLGFTIRI